MEFKKTWEVQKWFYDYKGTLYPFSIKYVWEHSKNGSLFKIDFLWVSQKYPESDLNIFFDEVAFDIVEDYLEDLNSEKMSLTVRFFKRNIDFLKNYAKNKDLPYQSLIRDAVDKYVSELKN